MKYAVVFYSESKCERVFTSTTRAEADFRESTLDAGETGCVRFDETTLKERLYLNDVSANSARYRVRQGALEERPISWVSAIGEASADSLVVRCEYSSEPPSTHRLCVKANGSSQVVELGESRELELETLETTDYEFQVESETHFPTVLSPLRISVGEA